MKKVIGGKLYDTRTADLIADCGGGNGRSDFRWFNEGLYKTKKGAFFLCGEGGPMTRWASSCSDGSRSSGEGITPLEPWEARSWCEHADVPADTIAAHFDVEEA